VFLSARRLKELPPRLKPVKCHICGSELIPVRTDLPFKVSETTIVIMKALPVLQCESCREYSLEDSVMRRVDEILERADARAELAVLCYTA
jgi:YgiT-type zinc finger domain-containing protein